MSQRLCHILIASFAVLFISLQSLAMGHGAAYDDAPHEHNGIACDISVLASDDISILPTPPSFDVPASDSAMDMHTAFTSAAYLRPACRAPPPRSPPTPQS